MKQLEKIDYAIQTKLVDITNGKEILKNTTINVSVISTDTKISRETFYNNDLLNLYVKSYSTSENKKTAPASDLEKLKDKNIELNRQINGFVLRDVETENLRHENKELMKEIKNLELRNKLLEEQYEVTQRELSEIKRQLATKNVVNIDGYLKK